MQRPCAARSCADADVCAARPEQLFDAITMSAFVGTPLDIALRDCGMVAVAIVGVALEVGIESTVRLAQSCRGRAVPGQPRVRR